MQKKQLLGKEQEQKSQVLRHREGEPPSTKRASSEGARTPLGALTSARLWSHVTEFSKEWGSKVCSTWPTWVQGRASAAVPPAGEDTHGQCKLPRWAGYLLARDSEFCELAEQVTEKQVSVVTIRSAWFTAYSLPRLFLLLNCELFEVDYRFCFEYTTPDKWWLLRCWIQKLRVFLPGTVQVTQWCWGWRRTSPGRTCCCCTK